jgi:hypothetical protein
MDPTIGVHAAGTSKATDDAHDAEEKPEGGCGSVGENRERK